MKNLLKRNISVLLIVMMTFLFVSCNKKVEQTSSGVNSMSGGNGLPIVKNKITLKIVAPTWATTDVTPDMDFYKELTKRTNIAFKFELLPLEETAQKFNLVMASGNLPDIISWGVKNDIVKYGKEGALIPLEDLIKKYGPNITSVLNNPPIDKVPYQQNIWGDITANDGHIYSIPFLNPSDAIGPVFGIRTDWLNKLELKIPDTTDDLYNVLKKFKEADPNGNGKADEIPYVADTAHWDGILPLVNSFGGHMGLYLDKNEDTIKYGPINDSYKKGLEYINKLFSEGLIDKEYANVTRDQWLQKITNNQTGLIFVWPGSGLGSANKAIEKIGDARYDAIIPFKGPNGDRYKDTSLSGSLAGLRSSISSTTKYKVEIIKLIDYMFSKDGELLVNYGIEGKHYTMVDGKPQYTDYILKNPDSKDPELAKVSSGLKTTVLPWWDTWDAEMGTMKQTAPWTVKAWEIYREPGIIEAPLPQVTIDDASINRKLADIETYKQQEINKFITGQQPLSNFSNYVSQVKKMGIDEVLKAYNDAYKVYKTNSAKYTVGK
ncbi:MAG: extracellular solute-binding protein [Clostridiales bacterium]|nr:extracellular solute-binding protein [Clostridiales bacterium]